ncbi:MAG: T9SS type A sorting domain-containing protein [Bacteroidota bacterium]
MRRILLVVLTAVTLASAQKRVLISSNNDVVPLKPGENAVQALQNLAKERGLMKISETSCANPIGFGYSVDPPPPTGAWTSLHKDIFGIWFQAPCDGVIDTLYTWNDGWMNSDSALILRLMESRIYNGSGPGYGKFAAYLPGYNFVGDPPMYINTPLCWGYFTDTNDLDGQGYNPGIGGVTAFADDATPPDSTAWVSTLQRQFPGAPTTFSAMGDEIWGLGGYPFRHLKAGAINKFNLHLIGAPSVHAGQPIYIAFIVPGIHPVIEEEVPTSIFRNDVPPDPNGFYHTHTWKFYEHNGTCGIPGWTDRGSFETYIWYSMTVTGDVPPRLMYMTNLGATLGGSPRDITVNLEDCNFDNPASAGVAWAHLGYSVDGGPFAIVPLNYAGGTTWNRQIPAVAPTTGRPYSRTVQYYVAAADSQGLAMDSGAVHSYKVVSFGNEFYYPDTSVACIPQIIKDTPGSHYLDTTSTLGSSPHPTWFSPPYRDAAKAPGNDGTAGPISLGGPFIYFGDTVNYAWIGVNGAMALSKTATDTIDVNSNGSYADYDFPDAEHLGRGDTAGRSNIPRNFIGTLWYDLVYVDDANVQYGRIFTKSDSCRFIAEYDSIGELYEPWAAFIPSNTTFRTVLNKCDGTIEMQWDNVQEAIALDTVSTVAFVGDSGRIIRPDSLRTQVGHNPGWLKFYRGSNYGPINLRPRDGRCVRFRPTAGTVVAAGWNMVSVPTHPPGDNYGRTYLYPNATSPAFSHHGYYRQDTTLAPGVGYWLKFPAANGYATPGPPVFSGVDSVKMDWNMVGAIGKPVATGAVVQDPANLVSSNYFGYNHGYFIATSLDPGKGYWVKSRGTGVLHLAASSIPKSSSAPADLTVLNRITVTDAEKNQQSLYIGSESDLKAPASMYEMPPVAPAGIFDVRFSSQRMVETYPDKLEGGKVYEFPMSIQTNAYPVTVQWDVKNTNGRTLTLTDGLGGRIVNNAVLTSSGSIRITNASVKSLVLKLVEGRPVPKEYALSQNYPNPFNPTTVIRYQLPVNSVVTLKVYNILGQEVAGLVNGMEDAGFKSVEFDGRSENGSMLPSGVYFYRIQAAGFIAVRKMLLLR